MAWKLLRAFERRHRDQGEEDPQAEDTREPMADPETEGILSSLGAEDVTIDAEDDAGGFFDEVEVMEESLFETEGELQPDDVCVYVDPDVDEDSPEQPSHEERIVAPKPSAALTRQLDRIGRRIVSEVGETREGAILAGFFSVSRNERSSALASAFAVHAAECGEQVRLLRRSREERTGFARGRNEADAELPRSRRVLTEGNSFMVVEASSSSELLRCVLSAKDLCSERELVVVDAGSLVEEPDGEKLLRLLDAVVMACRFGRLHWERGERSVARLRESGVRIVGAVITDDPTT